MTTLEVLFTPADFAALSQRDLRETVCVVFDVLRATSSMVTALANGAEAIIPVEEIPEALAIRQQQPSVLLAGERDGVRILANLTGSIAFDLGNSPREFTAEKVRGKTIAMSTTNGTRALRACAGAQAVLIGSFLNLRATAEFLERERPANLLLVCSGTHDQAAYEDVLGAGALSPCSGLITVPEPWQIPPGWPAGFTRLEQGDPLAAIAQSRNGQRLMALPELCDDVPFCARRDLFGLVAELAKDGLVTIRRT